MGTAFSRVLAGLLAATVVGAAEPSAPEKGQVIRSEDHSALTRRIESRSEPWLGVSIHKPSQALYEKLSGVPKAVGFVVHEVTPTGPVAAAGLRQSDFLWMLDDQLLINEAQFLALLHLRKAGETVKLTYQREGENREALVVLKERPSAERGRHLADVAIMGDPPIPGVPNQIVDILRQVASIKDADGVTVRLERQDEGFHWQQVGPEGRLIQEGDVKGMDDIRFPPGTNDELAKKLRALIRAFEDAEKRAESGVPSSRVRRIPRSEGDKVGNP